MAFQCGAVSTKLFQWYSSVHWVNQWHSSGIPVYTGPASVHWLRVRAITMKVQPLLMEVVDPTKVYSCFCSYQVSRWVSLCGFSDHQYVHRDRLYEKNYTMRCHVYSISIKIWYKLFFLTLIGNIRADCRLAPSQRETSLQSKAVSHWLGAKLESALDIIAMDSRGLFAHVPQTYFTSTGRSLQCPSTNELIWRIRVNRDGWEPGLFCDKYWSANGYSDCYIAYTWSADGYEQDDS